MPDQNRFLSVAAGLVLALAGCATQPRDTAHPLSARDTQQYLAQLIDPSLLKGDETAPSESIALATQALRYIAQSDLTRASKAINAAVQLDGRNSYLHFINAFVYQLQAKQGDSKKNELAVEGYRTALRLDPGNWIAQEFLGLAYLDLKQFARAKEQFAQVLLMAPDSVASMNGLMVSAYLTGDGQMACAMADRMRERASDLDPTFLRSSVSVYSACGKFDAAAQMRRQLSASGADSAMLERADLRMEQWRDFEASGVGVVPAAAFTVTTRQEPKPAAVPLPDYLTTRPPVAAPPGSGATAPEAADEKSVVQTAPAATAPAGGDDNSMVLVDVVIISTQETVSSSKGVNLLNALTLQLGSATAPAYSWTFDDASANRTVITKAVTVPALAYSMNIANAASSTNEVLARPTLAATEGLPSEFFAGVNVNAGVLSTSSLGSASVVPIDKKFGVRLAITPNFLPGGMVRLKVQAQRTFIVPNASGGQFAYRFDLSETSTDANVVMKLGDTLVLGGLTEKETSRSRDGVPGLQDIPGAQLLFSRKTESDFQRSALILITPRTPIYAARAEGASETTAERALRERLGFKPLPSNAETITAYQAQTGLFRQFRQGDVAMARWDRTATTAERLRQALSFLYY